MESKKADVLVLETGLGGMLDATNIFDDPSVTVITSVGLDHTKELGSTIESIATQKAGIIKENVPLVTWDNSEGEHYSQLPALLFGAVTETPRDVGQL